MKLNSLKNPDHSYVAIINKWATISYRKEITYKNNPGPKKYPWHLLLAAGKANCCKQQSVSATLKSDWAPLPYIIYIILDIG